MRSAGAIAIVLIATSVAGCATLAPASERDEVAIRQSVLAMTAAFNQRDDAALGAIATPDADFVTVVGRWARGTSAYVESRRGRFAGPLKGATIRNLETHVRFARPDLAIVHVTHEISGMRDEQGKPLAAHQELSTRV
ncbi:MAG TPA: SgcJ/EcaC family oxidoreductase, partial [Sphingomicrobium sp.]|nr:SgcJ/EcaC family oxidoreductase [Sphingomicrobium sp.]